MGLLAYGLMALAVLGAIGGFVGYERKAGGDSVRAELQPKLTACQDQVSTMSGQITKQNEAVASLKTTGDAKIAAASKSLAKATTDAQAARTEAQRLRALASQTVSPSACPAGDAVAEIRKGIL